MKTFTALFSVFLLSSPLLDKPKAEHVKESFIEIPSAGYGTGRRNPDPEEVKASVELPFDSRVIEVKAYIHNKGGSCALTQKDYWTPCPIGGGECSVGWADVLSYDVYNGSDNTVVTAIFRNWSDCNTRVGRLRVRYSD